MRQATAGETFLEFSKINFGEESDDNESDE
jgi:hypothetical protein